MPTVLVIDESRATLDSFGRALQEAGFSVSLASTGQEGLKLAGQRPFDLVVADLRLPDRADVDVPVIARRARLQLRQVLHDDSHRQLNLLPALRALTSPNLGAQDFTNPSRW